MKKTAFALSICLTGASGVAVAASTVVVSSPVSGGARMFSTIEVLNKDTMRIHVGTAPDYLIAVEGRLYSINGKEATDMTALRSQIRLPSIGDDEIKLLHKFKPTGREEIIAGIAGKVYQLNYYNAAMSYVTEEVVLSPDRRVEEVSHAWQTYVTSNSGGPELRGREVLHNYLNAYHLGVLRFGNNYKVESFGETPAADRFNLPIVVSSLAASATALSVVTTSPPIQAVVTPAAAAHSAYSENPGNSASRPVSVVPNVGKSDGNTTQQQLLNNALGEPPPIASDNTPNKVESASAAPGTVTTTPKKACVKKKDEEGALSRLFGKLMGRPAKVDAEDVDCE